MTKLKSLYMMALGMAMLAEGSQRPTLNDPEPLTEEEKQLKIDAQMKARGLKKFIINGKSIWALNEKNAIRKSLK